MASRKKQDEKNLKTLRELGALQHNKYCFDCNQRGPTYVDVTIGSFVCTKCSGMLRGLTPPHRVKSISMATFTNEEIEFLKTRGNDYCKRVWLGLYEGSPIVDSRDEQAVRDHMVNKYERKRYYLDPAQAIQNGSLKIENNTNSLPETKPLKTLIACPKPLKVNGNIRMNDTRRKRVESNRNDSGFIADFDKAEIFNSTNNNSSVNNGTSLQAGFANFENNPVFSNSTNVSTMNSLNNHPNMTLKKPAPPSEDKYAALKDLDNALKSQNPDNSLKSQTTLDWSVTSSNGSMTPNSLYSSPSPQNSLFGSPNQGHVMNGFSEKNMFANPFSSNGWQNNSNGFMANMQQPFGNPFHVIETTKMNGISQSFQSNSFSVGENGTSAWTVNPFKVSAASNGNSNNPFL